MAGRRAAGVFRRSPQPKPIRQPLSSVSRPTGISSLRGWSGTAWDGSLRQWDGTAWVVVGRLRTYEATGVWS